MWIIFRELMPILAKVKILWN